MPCVLNPFLDTHSRTVLQRLRQGRQHGVLLLMADCSKKVDGYKPAPQPGKSWQAQSWRATRSLDSAAKFSTRLFTSPLGLR
jgi:hypothetical protein